MRILAFESIVIFLGHSRNTSICCCSFGVSFRNESSRKRDTNVISRDTVDILYGRSESNAKTLSVSKSGTLTREENEKIFRYRPRFINGALTADTVAQSFEWVRDSAGRRGARRRRPADFRKSTRPTAETSVFFANRSRVA